MDSITLYDQIIYWFLLGSFSLIAILLFAIIVLKIYSILNIKNNINKKLQEVKDMKDKGEHHEWVEVNLNGTPVHVCKKTGYVPKHDGFIDTNKLKAYLADKEKLQEELNASNAYMKEVAEEIGSRYSLNSEQVSEIVKEYGEKQSTYFSQKIKDKMEGLLNKKH